jgi:hypothetical protein
MNNIDIEYIRIEMIAELLENFSHALFTCSIFFR